MEASVAAKLKIVDAEQLRLEHISELNPEDLEDLTDEEAEVLLKQWKLWARPNQLEPPPIIPETGELWSIWLILAGRGFGKTRAGVETCIDWVKTGQCKRLALVAEDSADARDVMVEGESGILACSQHDFMPDYEPSKRRLTWPNGALATLFSAEDYESLRGPQFDGAWCDELCKWRYAQQAWDNLMFGLRIGAHPRCIVTTTPRPITLLKDIILRSDTVITKGNTRENLVNLAPIFRKSVVEKYEGTRIGRQELDAEILDDVPGALWTRTILERQRIKPQSSEHPVQLPDFRRVVVAVDPPATEKAECGIIVCGIDGQGRGYLLEDSSLHGSPDEWGTTAVRAYDEWEADLLVYEANQGGDMVAQVIRNAARVMREKRVRDADFVSLKAVHATRGKYVRAEPVSQLYEQGKVYHVGFFAQLEDQMCEYTPDADMGYSPDRMDAMVWAFTELLVGGIPHEGLMDYMRQEAGRISDRLAGRVTSEPGTLISLKAPPGINTAYGSGGEKYQLEQDGLFRVLEKDIVPLIGAGFKRTE